MSTGRFFLVLLAALALAGGAAAGWVASPQIIALFDVAAPQPAAPVAEPEAPKPYDPLGEFDPGTIALLATPQQDAPSGFKRLPWIKPADFCRSLSALGLRNPMFEGGTEGVPTWNCITDLLKPAGTEEAAVSSLFVTARGDDPDRIGVLRLKLNLVDPKTTPIVKGIAKDLLTRIYANLGWELPQAMLDLVETAKDGKIDDYGVTFDFRREFGPADRYNLIVTFPQRLGAGAEDSFYTTRRRPTSLPPGALPQQPDGSPLQPGMGGFGQQPGLDGQPLPGQDQSGPTGLPQQAPPAQMQ